MFRKPVFQKPGGEKEFLNEEWIIEDRSSNVEYTNYVYNPNVSLSITQQRERLPVFRNRMDILYLLEKHRVLIVTGETGSGKSTQIPQYLMEAGWAQKGQMIGVTQPRRMAAITLARRVAEEKGCLVGQEVGYCVRFDECFDREGTKIKLCPLFQFMTEGILVNEIMANPLLPTYSVLMLDEAHERTLLTDTSLGLMKKILLKRPDLRLIISSATLEAEVLKQFFHSDIESKNISAEILSIQGRAYPVEVYYLSNPVSNYVKATVETVVKIHETQRMGHVLVFLTGQDEVEEAVNLLKEYSRNTKNTPGIPSMYVLPLYGSLPQSEQMKAFQPFSPKVRKVVVATNIAEASVTINGIVYVVDCGFVKLNFFNPKTSTDALVVVPESQSSATQRAGRAGRVSSGKVYRLFREDDFKQLPVFTTPEIQRSNLSTFILQLKSLGVDNIAHFSFPSPPPSKIVINALELDYALGALGNNGNLTELGMKMVMFPVPAMQAKMLLVSGEFGCSEEALTIVSMLQIESIFLFPSNRRVEARKAKYKFSVLEGDLLTLLNVYNAFLKEIQTWCADVL
ncbi:probable ATP-dependent RNA helicase DHX35 isoform X3 [Rhipicephalus sanguineus]|uniref:probable ATP-dependent RNA helicase DHX35 isoform X3 n=1 Tax=Rhipicephalus sanguineus TaxID=34632 RepID=UPI0020C3BF4D|nr:probable ATP-dependent RNA helicase DHX35 isoform X3 [Rhipicephalus sanguineus]